MIKVKVKATLEHASKAQRRVDLQLYSFFNLGASWGYVVNATPRLLYLRKRTGAHCTGGWVVPRAGPPVAAGGSPTGIRSRTVQPVVSRYTD